jgi:GTP-binding protein
LFIDQAKILIKSGNGGSGAVSFRREKYAPRGGPDGGDGGRGGHVIFVAGNNLSTLSDFHYKHHFQAENGSPGEGTNRSGKDGTDLRISVPPGTIIKDSASQRIIADLTEFGMEVVILKGGRGGRGNARFSSSTRQTPRFSEKGEPGSELWLELELKLIADVGLIGYPNAGKSTLISRISAARPKIADYPFTTLIPNLGVVDYKNQSFVAVDIPGLIEGAHAGVGLGDEFLRHIERTRLLVHMVDVSSFSGRDPWQDFCQINEELRLFNPVLADKTQLIVANKIDLPESRPVLEDFCNRFSERFSDRTVIPISAATGAGIDELLDKIIEKLAELPKEDVLPLAEVITNFGTDQDSLIQVIRDDTAYQVFNDALIKRMARFDLANDESIQSLQKLLKRWGVITALLNAGIQEGDLVRIGDFEFIYYSED